MLHSLLFTVFQITQIYFYVHKLGEDREKYFNKFGLESLQQQKEEWEMKEYYQERSIIFLKTNTIAKSEMNDWALASNWCCIVSRKQELPYFELSIIPGFVL